MTKEQGISGKGLDVFFSSDSRIKPVSKKKYSITVIIRKEKKPQETPQKTGENQSQTEFQPRAA